MTATETAIREEFGVIQESTLKVDRSGSRPVVHGAKLVGLTSRNGRRYPPATLKAALKLYEGAKINDDHPKGQSVAARGYRDRMGNVIPGTVVFREGQGLFGDLSMNPKHALTEQFLNDAEFAPQNVALSHNVLGRVVREGAEQVVETISRVVSVDVVGDPGSTNQLFESEDFEAMKTVKKTLRVLLAESLGPLAGAYNAICEANGIPLDAEHEVAESLAADARLVGVVENLSLVEMRGSAADKWDKMKRFDQLRADVAAKATPVTEKYSANGSAGGASSAANSGGAAAGNDPFQTKVLESLTSITAKLAEHDKKFAKDDNRALAESLCAEMGVKSTPALLEKLGAMGSPAEMKLELVMNHGKPERGPARMTESRNSQPQNYTPPANAKELAQRIRGN